MRKKFGTFLFYVLWPLVWFYSPLRIRVRVLLVHKNEILVVKNWFGPNSWQLPGGGMKFGESSVDTAIREIKEELAVSVSEKEIRLVNETAEVVHSYGLLFRYQYLVVIFDKKPEISLSSEVTDSKWIKAADMKLPKSVEAYLL